MSLPNMTHAGKPVDYDRCQTIAWNILQLMTVTQNTSITASTLMREFFQTSRCDNFYSPEVKKLRTDIGDYLGPTSLEKLDAYDEDENTERRCSQAFVHYNAWTKQVLRSELSRTNKIFFFYYDQTERIFAAVGLLGTLFVGVRGTARILRNSKDKLDSVTRKATQETKTSPKT